MVQINSSSKLNGRNGNGGGLISSYLPTIFMVFLGSCLAVLTSHFLIFPESSHEISKHDDDYIKTKSFASTKAKRDATANASVHKTSSGETTTEDRSYYDSIFKNPLKMFEDELKNMPNAPTLKAVNKEPSPPLGSGGFSTTPPQASGGLISSTSRFTNPLAKPGGGIRWPHTGPLANVETMYPLGPDFEKELEHIPATPLNISFLENVSAGHKIHERHDSVEASEHDSKSVFDCDSPYGRCVYWYPSHFFSNSTVNDVKAQDGEDAVFAPENQYGKGGRFYHILETMESLLRDHKLWINMPYIGLWTMRFDPRWSNPVTRQPFTRQNVTFIHIHKTGGTTIVRHANSQMTALTGKPSDQYRVFMWQWLVNSNFDMTGRPLPPQGLRGFGPNKSPEDRIKMQKLLFDRAISHLETATTFQPVWHFKDHELFAVVRDPLDRFVSSIGQAMGALGSSKNGVANELKTLCINANEYSKEASQFTLQCMIDVVTERGFFFEIHFTPQAVETAFATQMLPDTPVALFPMEALPQVLTAIGCDPNKKIRDGQGSYRPHKVLAGMTSEDYTPHLIRQVCILYEVDVVMLRLLGYEVPRCDEYISKDR